MVEFWSSLDSFEKILWGIALPASLVFVIQSALTFMGMDSHDGVSAESSGDGDSSPFQLFSFRNLINFMLGFSWAGISMYRHIESKAVVVLLSTLGGLLLVTVVMLIFFYMSRLGVNGNIFSEDTVGKTGIVYVPVSANRTRAGKIQITVKGAVREFDALTDGDALKTGEPVIVKSVIEGSLLLVQKI